MSACRHETDGERRAAMKNRGTWRAVIGSSMPMMKMGNSRHFPVGTRPFQIERWRLTFAVYWLGQIQNRALSQAAIDGRRHNAEVRPYHFPLPT